MTTPDLTPAERAVANALADAYTDGHLDRGMVVTSGGNPRYETKRPPSPREVAVIAVAAARDALARQWRCAPPDTLTVCKVCTDGRQYTDTEFIPHAREAHPDLPILFDLPYTATICAHRLCLLFDRCRDVEKWTGAPCQCPCHRGEAPDATPYATAEDADALVEAMNAGYRLVPPGTVLLTIEAAEKVAERATLTALDELNERGLILTDERRDEIRAETLRAAAERAEEAMRAESDRLASPETARSVEWGIGVAKAMNNVLAAIDPGRRTGEPEPITATKLVYNVPLARGVCDSCDKPVLYNLADHAAPIVEHVDPDVECDNPWPAVPAPPAAEEVPHVQP